LAETQFLTPSSLLEVRRDLAEQQRLELVVLEACRPILVEQLARTAVVEVMAHQQTKLLLLSLAGQGAQAAAESMPLRMGLLVGGEANQMRSTLQAALLA